MLTTSGISYGFTSDVKTGPIMASAFVDIDTDGDGLGDTWEMDNFGTLDYDGDDDYDEDGYTNLWEYQHGTDPTDPDDPNFYFTASTDALRFLKTMMDRRVHSGRRILYSYVDIDGDTEGIGWTYDNAISIIAFEERGEWQRAKNVLDAFIWFQDKDPVGDGRIRRSYLANMPIPADSSGIDDCSDWIPDDSEAQNQSVGDMAIMILAAIRYHEYIGEEDSPYLAFAKKLGDWIYENARSTNGAGGYNMARNGLELGGSTDRKSTENNIDAYAAFMKLYEALNDHNYRIYGLYAKNFLLAMWNEDDRMFWTGTLDDGETINGGEDSDVTGYDGENPTSGQPEDVDTWGLLALGETDKYSDGVDWVEDNCKLEDMDGFAFGYDFNADRDGIWFEGMSHMALAYQMLDNDDKLKSILNVIRDAQDIGTGGIQCASHDGITTSFDLWTLGTDLHVAPAAWFIFAVDGYNPFWAQAITEPIPYEGGYDEDGDQYVFDEPWAEASVTYIEREEDDPARAMVDFEGEGGDDRGTITVDDDGEIVKYEWDFDGKGTYDWSSTQTGSVQYWYTEVGTHNAKFRVTNDRGYASTRGVTVNISEDHLGARPPVVSGVSPSVTRGRAPLTVTFTGSGNATHDNSYIASYEWDFDGNGEYDSYSSTSGNITYTYREKGIYEPTFKVTDKNGLTDTATLVIEVLENPAGPRAMASANHTVDSAPHRVTFSAAGSSGSISRYEWDFEGNGIYVLTPDGTITHTYGEPGTYEARLRVTANGISDTDTVKIRVEHTAGAPEAVGSAEPSRGIIPFDVTFTHSSSAGIIEKYEWDFQGDKDYDWSSETASDATHTYTRPGYYFATLKVTDEDGLSDRYYVPIVATGPDQRGARYSSYIKTPQSGQRIYGNSVTVAIRILPNEREQDVRLQYRSTTAGENDWTEKDARISYPYRTTINATVDVAADLLPGDYYLHAPVNGIADEAIPTMVTVDRNNWDIRENINGDGERIKEVKINNSEGASVELLDGTRCEIKAGTLGEDATLIDILTVKAPNGSGRFVNDGTNSILYHREFSLQDTAALNKSITIIIPYNDTDNNGTVDDLDMPEEDLELYVYNKTSGEWEYLLKPTVYGNDNYISAEVSHLSIFGLGILGGGAQQDGGANGAGGGSGGGGGGGRSCFIATATFGTPMAAEVQSLRHFRDAYLLTNSPGEVVIDMYERYSPPIAKVIERSEFLKGMVRFYLRPIITFSTFANTMYRGLASIHKGAGCDD